MHVVTVALLLAMKFLARALFLVFLLLGVGSLAALGVLSLVPVFPRIFEVPADRASEVNLALALVGQPNPAGRGTPGRSGR